MVSDQQRRPTRLDRRRSDRQHRLGDLLAGPHSFHDRHPLGHATHGLRRRIRADGLVVLDPAADAEAHGQPPAAQHVPGRQCLGQHDRVVQLRHDHRRHQPHPIRPGRQRAHQRQRFRVVEGHPLAPTQRRERAVVDRAGPVPQHGRIQLRLHDRHGHRYLHDRDSGMHTGDCTRAAQWQHDWDGSSPPIPSRMYGSPSPTSSGLDSSTRASSVGRFCIEIPDNADEATREQLAFLFGGVIYDMGGALIALRPVATDRFHEDRAGWTTSRSGRPTRPN